MKALCELGYDQLLDRWDPDDPDKDILILVCWWNDIVPDPELADFEIIELLQKSGAEDMRYRGGWRGGLYD